MCLQLVPRRWSLTALTVVRPEWLVVGHGNLERLAWRVWFNHSRRSWPAPIDSLAHPVEKAAWVGGNVGARLEANGAYCADQSC